MCFALSYQVQNPWPAGTFPQKWQKPYPLLFLIHSATQLLQLRVHLLQLEVFLIQHLGQLIKLVSLFFLQHTDNKSRQLIEVKIN